MRTITLLILLVISNGLFAQLEIPKYEADDTIIIHRGYTLSYNPKYKQANWVAYLLTNASTTLSNRAKRGEFFAPDPLIPGTNLGVDYAKSGYDRGHLAPAADMGYSMETMVQSFFYSNMSPQVPRFNRGIWKKLEIQVRNWAIQYDSLYIVTGPIFSDSMKVIGPHRVAVPKAYYKVLIQKRNGKWFGIGFVLPNASLKGDIKQFATSIDKVEELTGINFFYWLDDKSELIIESVSDLF
ncbi:MAG: DNA/RNA non-specific endonuclease [Crocinitomicaceae bacterium]|jgi:endonuclease G